MRQKEREREEFKKGRARSARPTTPTSPLWFCQLYAIIFYIMFGKLKQFAIKKVFQSQMKNVPEEQQKMIMEMIEKNPELFEKIATEVQSELKTNGNNQQAAMLKILPKYQKEILETMSPETREALMKTQMNAQSMGQFNADGSVRK